MISQSAVSFYATQSSQIENTNPFYSYNTTFSPPLWFKPFVTGRISPITTQPNNEAKKAIRIESTAIPLSFTLTNNQAILGKR